MNLFRTKSLEQLKASAEEPEHQLKKNLGAFEDHLTERLLAH